MPDSGQIDSVIRPVQTTIVVNAEEEPLPNAHVGSYVATQGDILSSAGTWEDATRYLQVLPGVVWNTDVSNDVIVRGGHPSENLYVVDGIEIPNINHIAFEGTTGGFTSMIDTASISSVDMKPGVYDAQYSSRLSSLIVIHTLGSDLPKRRELDLGFSGAGGLVQRPLGRTGNLLLSAHRSVLNLVTDDIGINGVPVYTNELTRLGWSPSAMDHLSVLSLTGTDSLNINPNACDHGVSLPNQTMYEGTRTTQGGNWQHVHSPSTISMVTASYSAQMQSIQQQEQSTSYVDYTQCMDHPIQRTPIYSERSFDGASSLEYGVQFERGKWFVSTGATGKITQIDYRVEQPLGQQSPFNTNPISTDVTNFSRDFATGQTGIYLEGTAHFRQWTLTVGAREETFALTGSHAFDPRGSVTFPIGKHQAAHLSYGRSVQLAPPINIVSYSQNALLLPIRLKQFSAGADLWHASRATVSVEAYRKDYSDEPVSTEYPSLMSANMVDTLGQQFVWLPLRTGGRGRAEGAELLIRMQQAKRLQLLGSVTYGRTLYAAADGVLRPGNFDLPLVANGLASVRLPLGIQVSVRNTYASGRPYTPFDIPLSEQQSRGIYDLTRVNAMRGPRYNRLDFDLNRVFRVRTGLLRFRGGVENALNRENFLGYVWLDNCRAPWQASCGDTPLPQYGVPQIKVAQMPIFPDGSVRYTF